MQHRRRVRCDIPGGCGGRGSHCEGDLQKCDGREQEEGDLHELGPLVRYECRVCNRTIGSGFEVAVVVK